METRREDYSVLVTLCNSTIDRLGESQTSRECALCDWIGALRGPLSLAHLEFLCLLFCLAFGLHPPVSLLLRVVWDLLRDARTLLYKSIGTTPLGYWLPILIIFLSFCVGCFRNRHKFMEHLKSSVRDGFVVALVVWSLLYAFQVYRATRAYLYPVIVWDTKPPEPPAPTYSPAPSMRKLPEPMPELRERALHLSDEIERFVSLRERQAPVGMTRPRQIVVGGKIIPDPTPPFMRETLSIFVDLFEARIIDIYDEFSVRGLQDSDLDAAKDVPKTAGNIHGEIIAIAEAIRKLALLTPPDNLYSQLSNERLYEMAIQEAGNSENRDNTAFKKLQVDPDNRDAERAFFFWDFKQCCLNQIEFLRAVLIKRIGPYAIDQDEMLYFNGRDVGITNDNPEASISAVHNYIPKFRELAAKLNRTPRP